MNSFEIVKRAIEFNYPERMPFESNSMGLKDIHVVHWNQIGTGNDYLNCVNKKENYDEWGCLWERTEQSNMGQVKGHPLLDWNMMDKFSWPDPDNLGFYEGMEERFSGSEGKYISTEIFMLLFERMHSLRGLENMLMDLYIEQENIEKLADRIVEFDIAIIKNIAARFPGRINCLRFTDDWGTELSTFIDPKLWREFFKPKYKKIFDAVKKSGWHVWMHSCGKINEIIGDLIEIGVNVLNLQQPLTLGIEEIGKRFAGKVCFATTCDIQHTLPFKGEKEIFDEAKLLMECWGTEKGGIILSEYGDGTSIGVSKEKSRAMFEAFTKLDRWKK